MHLCIPLLQNGGTDKSVPYAHKSGFRQFQGHPFGCPFVCLAAAAVIVAAAVGIVAAPHTAAAAAEQENQNDNPADVAAAETIVITHKTYLRKISSAAIAAHSKIFRSRFFVQTLKSFP